MVRPSTIRVSAARVTITTAQPASQRQPFSGCFQMLAFGSFASCIARLDRPSADSSWCRAGRPNKCKSNAAVKPRFPLFVFLATRLHFIGWNGWFEWVVERFRF